MVDLQPLFATAQRLAGQAIATSGCTVRVETRTPGPNLGDPDQTTVLGTYPALITPATDGTTQPLPGVEVRSTDWKLLLPPTTPPPGVGVWVVCETNPHPDLIGQSAKVLGTGVDPSGSVLPVFARPGRD